MLKSESVSSVLVKRDYLYLYPYLYLNDITKIKINDKGANVDAQVRIGE